MPRRLGIVPFSLTALCILGADQYTKHLAVHFLRFRPGGIPALGHWLWLNYVENRGGAFGILQHDIPVFVATGVIVVALLALYWQHIDRLPVWQAVAYGLVLGGTVGNLYDRLHLGYVVDFVDLRWFPVFNVADSAICVGLGLIAISLMRAEPPAASPGPTGSKPLAARQPDQSVTETGVPPPTAEVNPPADESRSYGTIVA